MKTERLKKVIKISINARDMALDYYGKVKATRKEDTTLVTKADLEVGAYINRRLQEEFPGYAVVNEETADKGEVRIKEGRYTWIVDPIDGTASYSSRLPIWGVGIGLLKGAEPVGGVFNMPVTGETYYTDEGAGAYFESKRWGTEELHLPQCDEPIHQDSVMFATSYAHQKLNVKFKGKVRSMGSTLAHICYTARGNGIATVLKGSIWDIVAGWAVLKNAGGVVKYIDGRTSPDFMILTCPAYLKRLLGNITRKSTVQTC